MPFFVGFEGHSSENLFLRRSFFDGIRINFDWSQNLREFEMFINFFNSVNVGKPFTNTLRDTPYHLTTPPGAQRHHDANG